MQHRLVVLTMLMLIAASCGGTPTMEPTRTTVPTPITRLAAIPANAVKVTPDDDPWPPIVASGWSEPVRLDAPINTAGGEDSPFVTPDGQRLYFFFTPDVQVPAEKQLLDGVTGIWVAQRTDSGWAGPERVTLAEPGDLHLDGCPFVLGGWMIFCSARVGNYREVDLYTATWRDGTWTD